MRIWVEQRGSGSQVNFQPDSPEEREQLDQLLNFRYSDRHLSTERDRTVEEGAPSIATLDGHETQRWILIEGSR